MSWEGETEHVCYGISHKLICPLLKQWRQVAKGKATAESAGLREAMVERASPGHVTAACHAVVLGAASAMLMGRDFESESLAAVQAVRCVRSSRSVFQRAHVPALSRAPYPCMDRQPR